MQLDVARRLTHRVTVTPFTGHAETGELVYGSAIGNVMCFIEPTRRRTLSMRGVTVVVECSILFLASQSIKVGDRVSQGISSTGRPLLGPGVIVMVDDSYHQREGRRLRYAEVALVVEIETGAVYTWVSTTPIWAGDSPLWIDYAGS